MSEQFLTPMPFGWFCIGYSDEIKAGEVKNIHYFDRDMVLFRTEGGELGLSDPYCPHLGAHLGHGGEVVGESIRCPFHHWTYNNKGFVTDVPYAKQIPPKAQGKSVLKTYPIVEKSQVLWAWYHPEDIEPWFDVIENPEVNDPDWMPLDRYFWTYKSTPQEIAENGVDIAHFKYIHNMGAVPEGESTYEEYIRRSMAEGPMMCPDGKGGEIEMTTRVNTVQNGAGQKWSRLQGVIETLLLVLVTPVNDHQVEMRFAFTHKRYDEGSVEYQACRDSIANTIGEENGLEPDIVVWHNKKHLKEPLLCDGDGPIMRYRKYFSQFYVGGPYGNDDQPAKLASVKTA